MTQIDPARQEKLQSNLRLVNDKIAASQLKAGAAGDRAGFLAVVKYADPEEVKYLVNSGGDSRAGENKVQDARKKWAEGPLAEARDRVELHFIGHLQTNKAADAVELFDWIDSVDSLKLAVRLNRCAEALGKKMPVLIQLKLTDADTQGGVPPEQGRELAEEMRKLPFLMPSGYMAIAPLADDPETLRPLFREVRRVFDRDFPGTVNSYGLRNTLSLGMSGDFEVAVQEGSNLPRIGSLLFA